MYVTNGLSFILVAAGIDLALPVSVTVGGRVLDPDQYTVTDITPVNVVLDSAPEPGEQVTVSITQAITWYQPGVNTPSDGVPLQETDTQAARFIRGEI